MKNSQRTPAMAQKVCLEIGFFASAMEMGYGLGIKRSSFGKWNYKFQGKWVGIANLDQLVKR